MPVLFLFGLGAWLLWSMRMSAGGTGRALTASSVANMPGSRVSVLPSVTYDMVAVHPQPLSPSDIVGLQNGITQQMAREGDSLSDLALIPTADGRGTTANFKFSSPDADRLRIGDAIKLGSGNFVFPFTIVRITRVDGRPIAVS